MILFCKVFHTFAMHVYHTGSAAVTRAVRPSHGQCGRHTGSAAVTRLQCDVLQNLLFGYNKSVLVTQSNIIFKKNIVLV